jgi:hypothetical protein
VSVSDQDESDELANSLLRRLLNQDTEPRIPDEPLPESGASVPEDALVSPIPGYTIPAQPTGDESDEPRKSPIRPVVPDDTEPQPPLAPSLPDRAAPDPLTPREQMQRAEEALINLREKMASVAAEFADGKLNQAQFDAIYARYSEQRDITERLLTRNPESQAWQSVVQAGHTQFLKQHFEARVLSYAIYDQATFERVSITGKVQLQHGQVKAVLHRLQAVIAARGNPGPALRKLDADRSVLFVPGSITTAVVIFSLEPAAAQIARVADIHRDFERANQFALRNRDYAGERLVYPHRALFEH